MCCSRCQASGVGSALPLLRPLLPLAVAAEAGGTLPRRKLGRGPEAVGAEAGEERSQAWSERSLLGVSAAGSSRPGVSCPAPPSASAPAIASDRWLTTVLAPLKLLVAPAGTGGLSTACELAEPSKLGLL